MKSETGGVDKTCVPTTVFSVESRVTCGAISDQLSSECQPHRMVGGERSVRTESLTRVAAFAGSDAAEHFRIAHRRMSFNGTTTSSGTPFPVPAPRRKKSASQLSKTLPNLDRTNVDGRFSIQSEAIVYQAGSTSGLAEVAYVVDATVSDIQVEFDRRVATSSVFGAPGWAEEARNTSIDKRIRDTSTTVDDERCAVLDDGVFGGLRSSDVFDLNDVDSDNADCSRRLYRRQLPQLPAPLPARQGHRRIEITRSRPIEVT